MLPARKASLSLPQLLFSFLIKMFQIGGFLLSFYFLLLIWQMQPKPYLYLLLFMLGLCNWLYLSAKCFRNSSQPSNRALTLFFFQKEDCTEVHFVSILSGGFITAIVVNSPERKLAKCTSVDCFQVQNLPWNDKKVYFIKYTLDLAFC